MSGVLTKSYKKDECTSSRYYTHHLRKEAFLEASGSDWFELEMTAFRTPIDPRTIIEGKKRGKGATLVQQVTGSVVMISGRQTHFQPVLVLEMTQYLDSGDQLIHFSVLF